MKSTALSQLHYPFPDLINPQVVAMENYAAQVIDECTDLTAHLREKIKAASPAGLIARFFPLAGPEYVNTIVRYLVFAFIVEDTYTRLPFHELKTKCERVAAFLRDGVVLPDDGSAIKQLKACVDEAVMLNATPLWMQRYAQHNNEFLQSLLTETTFYNNNEAVRWPSFRECIKYREDQTDTYPFIDYIALVLDFPMPAAVYEHAYIQQLHELAAHFIVYVNDLYSVEKDLYNNEIMNVVLVAQHEEHCSLAEAQMKILHLHNADLAMFISLCASPPGFGAYNESIRTYIQYLQLFIQGNLSWHRMSKRYTEYA